MRKTWIAGATLTLVSTIMGGCCLTPAMWDALRMRPTQITQGVVADDGTIWLDVETTGTTQRVRIDASHARGHSSTKSMTEPAQGPLPVGESLRVVSSVWEPTNVLAPGWIVSLYPDGRHPIVQLRLIEPGTEDSAQVKLELPVDWTRPAAWGAVIITPVTAALDVFVFGPIHLLWIVWTAGGHGQPWLPFCER